jgi:precorrin-4/cobalt-precorrin-4 C11-methyltransferase
MIVFVGAGCGAPDSYPPGDRLLREADAVVYAGSLVNPALLDHVKPGCELHNSAP